MIGIKISRISLTFTPINCFSVARLYHSDCRHCRAYTYTLQHCVEAHNKYNNRKWNMTDNVWHWIPFTPYKFYINVWIMYIWMQIRLIDTAINVYSHIYIYMQHCAHHLLLSFCSDQQKMSIVMLLKYNMSVTNISNLFSAIQIAIYIHFVIFLEVMMYNRFHKIIQMSERFDSF